MQEEERLKAFIEERRVMTTRSVLGEVVRLGGLALQAEDCLIQAAVRRRGEHGGLARMENERYHQFIIWRAVLPLWHAVIERERGTDLILECEDGKHFFEMKNWRGASGDEQLPRMQKDIDKLQKRARGHFLVTAINPKESTDENFVHLAKNLNGLLWDAREKYRFPTKGLKGNDLEFWIAGWSVSRPAGTEQ